MARLLLLDEPSLGLAPRIIGQIGEVIAEINRQGTSVLLVEQNATMALGVADLAYVLDVGEVSLSGTRGARPDRRGAASISATTANRRPCIRRRVGQGSPGGRRDRRARRGGHPADIPPVEVDNISVRFGAIKALSEVSFTVEPGTIHAIIRPNGAGKSTMFNVLLGRLQGRRGPGPVR